MPPLTWEDVFWTGVGVMRLRFTELVPENKPGKPLTAANVRTAFFKCIAALVLADRALAVQADLVPLLSVPGDQYDSLFESRFGAWVRETQDLPRSAERRRVLDDVERAQSALLNIVAPENLVAGVLRAAVRKSARYKRFFELPHDLRAEDVQRHMHDVHAWHRGADGRYRANFNLIADRLNGELKARRRHVPLIDQASTSEEGRDPASAAEVADATHQARLVIEACQARGAAYRAALARATSPGMTREKAASAHGVTVKAIRHAEGWVNGEMARLRRRLEGPA